MFLHIILLAGFVAQGRGSYVWPSRYDFLEDLLAMHSGYLRFGFSDLVVPCSFGSAMPGVQNSAEWIRSAFHDMITHDISTGMGGLDASLMFELDRPENIGSAFNNTFAAMWDFITPKSSVSDLLALSVVAATAACGGPRIPFRAGRVDAAQAGPSGVPKPEDDLESTRQAFNKAGFNDEDMITMVACGHTLGNIHSVDFPELVEGEATKENNAHFDTSPNSFDNAVVTEYLESETSNPLVVSTNETMTSDKRIFGSDANATMTTLADPSTFQVKCGQIFERMINTVPEAVPLSEPVEIIDVKPYVNAPLLQENGTILFEGRIRVRNIPEKNINGDDLEVSLSYVDRQGFNNSDAITANRARIRGGQSFGFWGNTFTWFEFSKSLNASTAISTFKIHLRTPSSGVSLTLDNAGTGGYPVNSDLLFQQSESCMGGSGNTRTLSLVAALRKDLVVASNPPLLRIAHRVSRPGILLPELELRTTSFQIVSGVERHDFQYFKASASLDDSSWSTTFDIQSEAGPEGEVIRLESLKTNSLSNTCRS